MYAAIDMKSFYASVESAMTAEMYMTVTVDNGPMTLMADVCRNRHQLQEK